jgi:hypothetical protein
MGILIGMDEAGYGPNLGPLVIAASAWAVTEEVAGGREQGTGGHQLLSADCGLRTDRAGTQSTIRNPRSEIGYPDLYRSLRGTICRKASEKQIAIADSKVLYKPGAGLRQLERGVHSVYLAMRRSLGCWNELVDGCAADPDGHHRRLPWHHGFDCQLPVDADAEELVRLGERLARTDWPGRALPRSHVRSSCGRGWCFRRNSTICANTTATKGPRCRT